MLSDKPHVSRRLLDWIGLDRESIFGKFGQDLIWNFASFAIMAACGAGISLIIGRWYPPEVLGVFNQSYSVFVIASQFAVAGVHLSVVKHAAQFSKNEPVYRSLNTAAMLLASAFAALACAVLWLLRSQIGSLFESPAVTSGVTYLVPGLFFFSINKILLSIFNPTFRTLK